MQVAALHAANAALFISDIPFSTSIAAVRIGTVGDDIVINPTLSQQDESELDLLVVGSGKDVVMIEMRTLASENDSVQNANEFHEAALVDVIATAGEAIEKATSAYEEAFTPLVREPLELTLAEDKVDESLYAYIESNYADDVEKAISHMAKSERSTELKKVRTKNLSYGKK